MASRKSPKKRRVKARTPQSKIALGTIVPYPAAPAPIPVPTSTDVMQAVDSVALALAGCAKGLADLEDLRELGHIEELADNVSYLAQYIGDSLSDAANVYALGLILQHGSEDDRVAALDMTKGRFRRFEYPDRPDMW